MRGDGEPLWGSVMWPSHGTPQHREGLPAPASPHSGFGKGGTHATPLMSKPQNLGCPQVIHGAPSPVHP